MKGVKRRRVVVDDSALAMRIGERIRSARLAARLTQQQLAEGRYTKAYISALEKGHAKPSMAALNFLSERLGLPPSHFLGGQHAQWIHLEADLLLASDRWQEALEAYDTLVGSTFDRSSRARILAGRAEALCRLGRGVEAISPASEAVEQFRELGRERESALAGYWLSNALYLSENTAEARSLLGTLLDQVRAGSDVEPDLRMRLLRAMGAIETWDGNHDEAVTYLEEARALARDLDDRRRAAFLSALALAYQGSGDVEGAIRLGRESLALFRAAKAEHEIALLENDLANAYLAVGNVDRATELAAEASRELTRLGDEHELANVIDTDARIALAEGRTDRAIELARSAVAAAREGANPKALADAQLTMARAAVRANDGALAVEAYGQAAALLREHGPRVRLRQVLGEWAEVLATQGQHEAAYELTREALHHPPDVAPAH